MKKFLAVFDGFKMSNTTIDYSIQLSKVAHAHLVGVFLDEFIYHDYNLYHILETVDRPEEIIKEFDAKDRKKRDDAAQMFQEACEKAKIDFSVHRDKNMALQELYHESMFADLIIISEYETFTRKRDEPPTPFIKALLSDVQCPVLIVPTYFKPIDKIVLLYDGSPSALHAIKMFSYLFDNLLNLPVEVFTVVDQNESSIHLPARDLMMEFIERHFPKATYTVAKGNVRETIIDHLQNYKENELVVLGAYRRSDLSRWFKTSKADVLMKEVDTPLFIAHNK